MFEKYKELSLRAGDSSPNEAVHFVADFVFGKVQLYAQNGKVSFFKDSVRALSVVHWRARG